MKPAKDSSAAAAKIQYAGKGVQIHAFLRNDSGINLRG